jgi:hypothetical protein
MRTGIVTIGCRMQGLRAKATARSHHAFIGLVVTLLSSNALAQDWTFVWIGTTAQGWTVAQGTAVSKGTKDEMHFDLTASNSTKYSVDAQLSKDGTAEAGMAGLGDAYRGIAILKGKLVKGDVGSGCKAEILQVHNDFNMLAIGRFVGPGCK